MKSRVTLSLIAEQDVDFITNIKSNPSLWPYEYDIITDKNEVRKIVMDRISGDWYKQYIIKLNNEEMTPIGEFHIHWYVRERKSFEIGYCIFPEYQKQGYCLEAGKIVLDYAFKDWNAHKVVAMCNERNVASYRIMEKLGMTKEGVFKKELPRNDKWDNQLFFSILDNEYQNMFTL